DRAAGGFVDVPNSAGACGGGIDHWRSADAAGDVSGRNDSGRRRAGEFLQPHPIKGHLGDGDLWIYRLRFAGVDSALPAGLSLKLLEDWHDRAAGFWDDFGES